MVAEVEGEAEGTTMGLGTIMEEVSMVDVGMVAEVEAAAEVRTIEGEEGAMAKDLVDTMTTRR